MQRKLALAVAVILLVCVIAIRATVAGRPQAQLDPPRPEAIPEVAATGEGARAMPARATKEARIGRSQGAKIELKKLELDREVAENAGVLGATQDSDLDRTLGESGLSPELRGGIGGLIGTNGSQSGRGGVGGRGGGNFGSKPAPGQTVYVSNDDSMSLASAQHVLYALQNGQPLRGIDVRPHELLNYFTFRTATPDPGEVFDVLASAERDGDRLHVALAVQAAMPPRRPLDLTLLVDVSCSMEDDGKLDRTKRALHLLAEQLQTGDHVDLVVFDDKVRIPLRGWIRSGHATLDAAIESLTPGGSTDLDLGLREAYSVARSNEPNALRNGRILLITDARLNTGDVDPETVSEIARAYDESGIRLTGVGVGRDFDDDMLNRLTEKGKGAYVFLGSDAVVDRLFGPRGFASLTQTVAHDVRFAVKLPPSLSMEQFYGEEASTDPADVQPVHFSAGTSQVLLEDFRVHTFVPTDSIELEIRYRDPGTGEEQTQRFRSTIERMVASDPHNVRKARALMAWADLLGDLARNAGCTESNSSFRLRANQVGDDKEIRFVTDLVRGRCDDLHERSQF